MPNRTIQRFETETSSKASGSASREKPEMAAAEDARVASETPYHDEHVTRLSPEVFEAFREQLGTGETEPQVLEARERLVKLKPVWQE